MFFKVVYGKEIHVMNPKEKTSLAQLKEFIRTVFKKLPRKYMLTYTDCEGDQIALGNESDIAILHESALGSVKIYIEETSEEFFDQTEEVVIDTQEHIIPPKIEDEFIPEIEEKLNESISANESSISFIENLDESIEEKVKKMLPNIVGHVKTEILKESAVK